MASSFHFSHLFSFTFCLRCTILFFLKRRCEISKSNSSSKFKLSLQVLTFDLSMFFSFFHFASVYAQRRICEAMKEGGGFSIIFIFILLFIIYPLALTFIFFCVFSMFFSFCLLQNNNNFKSQSRGVGCEVKLEKSLEGLVGKSK